MTYTLTASQRTNLGRRAKNDLKQMLVPAVVYGHGIDAKSISVPRSEFLRILKTAGQSSLIDLTVADQPMVKVLMKEVQINPLTDEPTHVDFHQVRMDEELITRVPLKFVGESQAVKKDGGTLVKSLDELEVRCLPVNLPHEIEVDLAQLVTFEDAVTVGNLVLPKGVSTVEDPNITIATVARPMTEEELKKLEEVATVDVTTIKTEGEEKKAAEEAKKAEEAAAEAPAGEKKAEKK